MPDDLTIHIDVDTSRALRQIEVLTEARRVLDAPMMRLLGVQHGARQMSARALRIQRRARRATLRRTTRRDSRG